MLLLYRAASAPAGPQGAQSWDSWQNCTSRMSDLGLPLSLRLKNCLPETGNLGIEGIDPVAQRIDSVAIGPPDAPENLVHLVAHPFLNRVHRVALFRHPPHLPARPLPTLALGLLPRFALLNEGIEHLCPGITHHRDDAKSRPPYVVRAAECAGNDRSQSW